MKFSSKLLFLSIIILVAYLAASGGNTPYNYFTRLASAFLKGKYYLTENPPWLNELIPAGDNKYLVVYPPMPAIISIPFVAVFGENFPQQLIAHLLGAIFALYWAKIALKASKNKMLAIWTLLLAAFGNIVFFMSSSGSAWYLGQVSAAAFLTLAIYETAAKKRPVLIGIFLGAAYLSRLHTILSLPFFVYPLIKKRGQIFKLLLGAIPFFLFNFGYNYLRFGVIWDKSYTLIPGLFDEPWYQKGLVSLTYIPRHLRIIFSALPIFKKTPPYITPSWNGLAIWITTPAFIYALKAKLTEKANQLAWLAIAAISLVIFSHGTHGFAQFGYRFAVDFYPFLIFLTIKGLSKKKLKWHHWLLLALSVLVNTWGVIFINKLGWVSY